MKTRPNILLIMTDQHRGDALSCDGHRVLLTPNIDSLADRGVRFSRCFQGSHWRLRVTHQLSRR